jgi:hypothetical protein
MKMKLLWPIQKNWNHNDVSGMLLSEEINEDWNIFKQSLDSIDWKDVFAVHEKYYADKSKSISKALNHVINQYLMRVSDYKVPIFVDDIYGKVPYITEYKLGNLAIDVAFGHYNALVWKISRLNLAVVPSELKKSDNQSVGILILVGKELKKSGNFDPGIGTWEQAVEYLEPFKSQWKAPVLLLCIDDPGSFRIVDNGSRAVPRSTIHRWDP